MNNTSNFPPGWDEERVRQVLEHYDSQTYDSQTYDSQTYDSQTYDSQTEEEALAEDEAAFEDTTQTVMGIPNELVPLVRELLARHAG